MKTLSLLFFYLLTPCIILHGQENERQISVRGQVTKEFTATGATLSLTISEQQPNEYTRTSYIPFEATYTNFIEELFTLGIHENQLEKNPRASPHFDPMVSRDYILQTGNLDLVEKILSVKANGVRFNNVNFTFTTNDPSIEANLAKAALEDARAKAKQLSDMANLKVGKVISISDYSNGCCQNLQSSGSSKTEVVYQVTATFELLDK
ncbi:MAG: SIMPL domain-containing protein [Saprospiraceae bacterium]